MTDLVIPANQTVEWLKEHMVLGLDVSMWQGDIDWPTVAGLRRPDGRPLFEFVWIKASEDAWMTPNGISRPWRDPKFRRNWEAAAFHKLYRFPYHYTHPETTSPADSVTWFQETVKDVGGLWPGDCPLNDCEAGGGDNLIWQCEWLELTERVMWKPGFYSGHWWMARHGLEHPGIGGRGNPLALASYQSMLPPVPEGWPKIDFWQFTASATVPGILGDVDLDVYLGDTAGLDEMCKH